MQTITDHKWKFFKYIHEVPKKILDDYDHLNEDEKFDHWIQYRGTFYHLTDFMRIDDKECFWNGYYTISNCMGLVIRLSEDGGSFIIGRQ